VDADSANGSDDVEDLQEPKDDEDDDDAVDDGLDASGHGDVAIDETEQNAYDEQHNDDVDQAVNVHRWVRPLADLLIFGYGAIGLR
jgi:hypothetical protein